MKTLYESLLDDFDTLGAPLDAKIIKKQIKEFLQQTYKNPSYAKISRKPNEDGLYVVDWKSTLSIRDKKIEQLTNGLFTFGEVDGDFDCEECRNLKTLKGSPQIVHGDFDCRYCVALKSLKGGPRIVSGKFNFTACNSLTSLEGAPEKCQKVVTWDHHGHDITLNSLEGCPQAQDIVLEGIKGLKNLKGLPQMSKYVGYLHIGKCPDLESLEGGPTEIRDYTCRNCQNLKSLKGGPSKVSAVFICEYCHSLKNFEGAPEEVGTFQVCNNKMLDRNHPEVLKGFPKKAVGVKIFISKKEQEKLGIKFEPFTVEQICAVCDVNPRCVQVVCPFDN